MGRRGSGPAARQGPDTGVGDVGDGRRHAQAPSFTADEAADPFELQAPAGFQILEHRDLGAVVARVIRAKPGAPAISERHHHDVTFQLVYVLKGWIKFHYEGVGDVLMEPGTCVHQPPGIRHTELGHSDDLELLEIVMPGQFETLADEPAEAEAAAPQR